MTCCAVLVELSPRFAGLLENQLKTQRATAQVYGAAKPVRQSEVHGATAAATRQVVVDPRGATGLDLRANPLSQRHAAQDVVRAARPVMVLTAQPVATQVQHVTGGPAYCSL